MKGEPSYAKQYKSQKERTDATETEGAGEGIDAKDTEGDDKDSDGESRYKEIIDWAKKSIAKYDSTKH